MIRVSAVVVLTSTEPAESPESSRTSSVSSRSSTLSSSVLIVI